MAKEDEPVGGDGDRKRKWEEGDGGWLADGR